MAKKIGRQTPTRSHVIPYSKTYGMGLTRHRNQSVVKLNTIRTEICPEATIAGELIPEALVRHIGYESTDASTQVYNYLQGEWKKWVV